MLWLVFSFSHLPFYGQVSHDTLYNHIIRASVDVLYRDGAGRISRDPHTKRHQTRRERLDKPSRLVKILLRANIQLSIWPEVS